MMVVLGSVIFLLLLCSAFAVVVYENWKKRIFRLTLVLSALFGIFAGIIVGGIQNPAETFLTGFFIGYGLVWLIYLVVGFVRRGFASKSDPKR